MPIFTSAVVGALATGAASAYGAHKQASSAKEIAAESNEMNAQMAAEQRDWVSKEAVIARDFEASQARAMMEFQNAANAKQMGFQRDMSSTAHQREVADLRAAGLNPILSGTGGMGSSTPSGATSSGAMGHAPMPSGAAGKATPAPAYDIVTPAITTALNVANTFADVEKKKAETDNVKAQTGYTGELTKRTAAETLTEMEKPNLVKAQVISYIESAALNEATRSKIPLERDKLASEIAELGSRMVLQGKQGYAASASGQASESSARKMDEETRALEITKFVRKQVMGLEQSDIGGYMKDVPIDLIKGTLLHLLRGKAD